MIEVPSSTNTEDLADWAEASCLFGDRAFIPRHGLESSLEDVGISNPEMEVSNIWQEIELRHNIASEGHPIITLRGSLKRIRQWHENLPYAFQLLLALQSQYRTIRISSRRWIPTAKLFENLSTFALQHYIGGVAITTGAPRSGEVPSGFGDCLLYLCQKLGETPRTVRRYTSNTKDDGADVVAWRPVGDKRSGQVVIIAHCAAGKNWEEKKTELSIRLWREHVDWTVDPVKAFAFPFVCLDNMQWKRLSLASEGILFDRLRIASIVIAAGGIPDELERQLEEWCREQLQLLPIGE